MVNDIYVEDSTVCKQLVFDGRTKIMSVARSVVTLTEKSSEHHIKQKPVLLQQSLKLYI